MLNYDGEHYTVTSKTETLKEVARLVLFALVEPDYKDVAVLDAFPVQPDDDPALHGVSFVGVKGDS